MTKIVWNGCDNYVEAAQAEQRGYDFGRRKALPRRPGIHGIRRHRNRPGRPAEGRRRRTGFQRRFRQREREVLQVSGGKREGPKAPAPPMLRRNPFQ